MTTPSITSLGIGSGIDANSIVSKLMSIERIPLDQLNRREASYQAKISAFGALKTRFDALKTAAAKLADPAKLAAFTATIGDKAVLSATAGSLAGPGSYTVEVAQLAQAQKSFSPRYGTDDTFEAGTLTFTIGGKSVDVDFAGGSIHDLRSAINGANIGVTAATVTGVTDEGLPTTRLVFTAKETGTDNAFSLAVTGGNTNLQAIADFDAENLNAREARNALVFIEGERVTSQSNKISGAIPDVTITAQQVGTTTVDIARSSAGVLDTVKAFVTAFNDAARELKSASAYNAATKVGAPLNGDATVRSLQSLMRDTVSRTPDGLAGAAYETLSSLGISFSTDGSLVLNESKLTSAIDANFAGVTQTLNAFGAAMEDVAARVTRFDGLIANRTDGLGASVSRMAAQKTRMEYHLSLTEKRMRAQFTALDALMGQLTSTSAYLTQQLSQLSASKNM